MRDRRGCGGATGGLDALLRASQNQNVDIMAMLTDAGVIDTGEALIFAAGHCPEAPVKFLLQQHERTATNGRAYVNSRNREDQTPLHVAILYNRSSRSHRVVRLLMDSGADTTLSVRVMNNKGWVIFNDTPLAFVNNTLRMERVKPNHTGEKVVHKVEAIRRLLLQVDAVHAISWLWPSNAPPIAHAAEGKRTKAASPLTVMLPTLGRGTKNRGVLLVALFREVVMMT